MLLLVYTILIDTAIKYIHCAYSYLGKEFLLSLYALVLMRGSDDFRLVIKDCFVILETQI